jgi:hypothetical protein
MNNGRGFGSLAVVGAIVCASLATVSSGQTNASPSKQADPWSPVRPLLGSWEGDARGEPGSGRSEREYRLTLNDRFIHVSSETTYPPQDKNPKGEVHEDVGFISYDKSAQKLVFRQFHVEGFVNHYVLDSISADGRTIVFVTTFALAEPGKDFATYSETRFRRKR